MPGCGLQAPFRRPLAAPVVPDSARRGCAALIANQYRANTKAGAPSPHVGESVVVNGLDDDEPDEIALLQSQSPKVADAAPQFRPLRERIPAFSTVLLGQSERLAAGR